MTAVEYRETLDRLGLTQVGAAKLCGVNSRTSRRWADGKQEIPRPVARLLEMFRRFGVPADFLAE